MLTHKVCSRCKKRKAAKAFGVRASRPCGLTSRCKACAAELMRNKRKEDPEKFKARSRRDYWKNPEKFRQLAKEYQRKNPEKGKASHKVYYAANKERLKAEARKRLY